MSKPFADLSFTQPFRVNYKLAIVLAILAFVTETIITSVFTDKSHQHGPNHELGFFVLRTYALYRPRKLALYVVIPLAAANLIVTFVRLWNTHVIPNC